MTRKYFGTDGVRGRVGEHPITADWILRLGRAAGIVLAGKDKGAVVIGKDTRVSGYMFESALEAGLAAAGANVLLLGPMPTPAVAYLTRTLYACAGIVIGVITLTGLGIDFTSLVIAAAQNTMILALILTMVAGIILGMGMPTTPAYIVQVALLVPALVRLGVQVDLIAGSLEYEVVLACTARFQSVLCY